MRRTFKVMLVSIIAISGFTHAGGAIESIEAQVDELSNVIGFFPPAIENESQKSEIQARYVAVKKELDSLVAGTPSDARLLYVRGKLQAMGHNFDYPGAFGAASEDLKASLKIKPDNEDALLVLAGLWVNSDPNLAPKAENLFIAAQCYHGAKPLEQAQLGIFFARYYQGLMENAFQQAAYLKKTWPENEQYKSLFEMVKSVIERRGAAVKLPVGQLSMATCSSPNPAAT